MSRLLNTFTKALSRQSRSRHDDEESDRREEPTEDYRRSTYRPARIKAVGPGAFALEPIREDDESNNYFSLGSSTNSASTSNSSTSLPSTAGSDQSISFRSAKFAGLSSTDSSSSTQFGTPLSAPPRSVLLARYPRSPTSPTNTLCERQTVVVTHSSSVRSIPRAPPAPTPYTSPPDFQQFKSTDGPYDDRVDYHKPLLSSRSDSHTVLAYDTRSRAAGYSEQSFPDSTSGPPSAYSTSSYAARKHRAYKKHNHSKRLPARNPSTKFERTIITPPIVLSPSDLPMSRENWQVLLKGTYTHEDIDREPCPDTSHDYGHTQQSQRQSKNAAGTTFDDVFAALERCVLTTENVEEDEEVSTVQQANVCLFAKCRVRQRRKIQMPGPWNWLDLIVLEPVLEKTVPC